MLLATTSAKIEFVLGEAHATNQIPAYAAWFDSATAPTASSAGANSNDTTQVTLVASPGASTIRQINEATICNTDTINHKVTVRFNDGTNTFILQQATLAPGQTLLYSKQFGWVVVPTYAAGQIPGTATNDNAAAGNIGEIISSTSGATAISAGTPISPTSISVTPGDWDVTASFDFTGAGSLTWNRAIANIGTVNNSLNVSPGFLVANWYAGAAVAAFNPFVQVAAARVSLAATTTYYATCLGDFAGSGASATVIGMIIARRAR